MPQPPTPNLRLSHHPLTHLVPRMSDDDFRALRRSVRENGFLESERIVLYEGMILDGRHLYEACLLEGKTPLFREYTGSDPRTFVLTTMNRRNLTPSTRGLIAAKVLLRGRDRPDDPRYQLADVRRRLGVGETVVMEAVRVVTRGVPGLIRMVENGEVRVKAAAELARLTREEQEEFVSVGPKAVAAKVAQMRKAREAARRQFAGSARRGRGSPTAGRFRRLADEAPHTPADDVPSPEPADDLE